MSKRIWSICPCWFRYFFHGLPSTGSGYVSYYRLSGNADVGCAGCG